MVRRALASFRDPLREYGVGHIGGLSFDEDARRVRLDWLGLRLAERFVYEYDFYARWVHDARVEQMVALDAGRTYPRCIGDRRAAPPEDCDGVGAYLEWRQCHHLNVVAARMLELLGDEDLFDQHRGEFSTSCAGG